MNETFFRRLILPVLAALCVFSLASDHLRGRPTMTSAFCGTAVPAARAGETPMPQVIPRSLEDTLHAATPDPAAADYSGHKGRTLYVSKLGDNSDGSSWQKAFRTIQAALLAVPDDQGGHQIIIRPDTYVEANLYVKHKGIRGRIT